MLVVSSLPGFVSPSMKVNFPSFIESLDISTAPASVAGGESALPSAALSGRAFFISSVFTALAEEIISEKLYVPCRLSSSRIWGRSNTTCFTSTLFFSSGSAFTSIFTFFALRKSSLLKPFPLDTVRF